MCWWEQRPAEDGENEAPEDEAAAAAAVLVEDGPEFWQSMSQLSSSGSSGQFKVKPFTPPPPPGIRIDDCKLNFGYRYLYYWKFSFDRKRRRQTGLHAQTEEKLVAK